MQCRMTLGYHRSLLLLATPAPKVASDAARGGVCQHNVKKSEPSQETRGTAMHGMVMVAAAAEQRKRRIGEVRTIAARR